MLKEISVSQLKLGMFVAKMNGGWFDHPFWKSKFLVEEDATLTTLKSSALKSVVIDTSLGCDVEREGEMQPAPAPSSPKRRLNSIQRRHPAPKPQFQPASTTQEVGAAERVIDGANAKLMDMFVAARMGRVIRVATVAPVVTDIHASIRRNSQAFNGLMRCKLTNELFYKHSLCVSGLMISLARQMRLSERQILDAGLGGLMLDIGTNYYPKGLTAPDGDYSRLEPEIWQQHVALGHRALRYDDDMTDWSLNACSHHHERFDGSGFPDGLKGDEISLGGRMAAICDTFDFLLTDLGGTPAVDPAVAVKMLEGMHGAFDPDVLRKFIESVGRYPIGSFVLLRSNHLAMVIDENRSDDVRPLVLVFYSVEKGERTAPRRVDLSQSMDEDEILETVDLAAHGLPDEAYTREVLFLAGHAPANVA